ncbi:MAG: glycoside hydrolase family 130 protein [Planctomycetota bacterium]
MSKIAIGDVVQRSAGNPLISPHDLPFRSSDIWNAGVVAHAGECLLLLTVETLEGQYRLHRAVSSDERSFRIDREPFLIPTPPDQARMHERYGVRDPRITPMEDAYYITYVAEGDHGLRMGLARTTDFQSAQWLGYATQVDVKGGALFPRKIGGRYAALKRPNAGMSIWLSFSEDLTFWGSDTAIMTPRGGYWDTSRIGVAAPPMDIDEGWLLLYYGSKDTSAGPLVRLGAAVLDKDDPSRVLARGDIPILSPREKYERIGNVPNVVFSCGAMLRGDEVHIFYGASDSCICLGIARLDDVLAICHEGDS